jgi:hypothetical protein
LVDREVFDDDAMNTYSHHFNSSSRRVGVGFYPRGRSSSFAVGLVVSRLRGSSTLISLFVPACPPQPLEVFIDSESKLTLHGLIQYYVKLPEKEKNRKLTDLLDSLEFNQVIIFVSKPTRAVELNRLLEECNFPTMCIHGKMKDRCVRQWQRCPQPCLGDD